MIRRTVILLAATAAALLGPAAAAEACARHTPKPKPVVHHHHRHHKAVKPVVNHARTTTITKSCSQAQSSSISNVSNGGILSGNLINVSPNVAVAVLGTANTGQICSVD